MTIQASRSAGNNGSLSIPTIMGAPLLLRFARAMSRSHIRGAGVLTRLLRKLGVLNVFAEYRLNHIRFGVPLNRIPWDHKDVVGYEAQFLDRFIRALSPLQETTFFDCGADIGTFSALLCSRTNRIARVVAFEPSPAACEFLRANLSNLGVPWDLIPKAVSNFEGSGLLVRPDCDPSDHARFLAPGEGTIPVITIDTLGLTQGDIAIKLDLEGGELEALSGARRTIASARHCIVGLEASPAVKARTGRDPLECLKFLESIRRFEFVVAETGQSLDLSTPVLRSEQTQIWNLLGCSYRNMS